MDASSELQEMQNHSLENVLACPKTQQDRKPIRPQPEQALKCPRCESTNTKFCYYNNYSLSQPRYFCKSCRRYWTKGGTLRNVPVGGGCRKNKRSSSYSQKRIQDNPNAPLTGFQTIGRSYDSNDLALAFARLHEKQSHEQQLGYEDHDMPILGHQCNIFEYHNVHANTGYLDALRSGYLDNIHNGFRIGNAGNLGDMDSSSARESVKVSADMVMPYDQENSTAETSTHAVRVTTMKQEVCNDARESESRVLWGFPWQFNGDGNMSDLAALSWHGLVNSPLM